MPRYDHAAEAENLIDDLWGDLVEIEDPDDPQETIFQSMREYLEDNPDENADDLETQEYTDEERALELQCEILRQLAAIRDLLSPAKSGSDKPTKRSHQARHNQNSR